MAVSYVEADVHAHVATERYSTFSRDMKQVLLSPMKMFSVLYAMQYVGHAL